MLATTNLQFMAPLTTGATTELALTAPQLPGKPPTVVDIDFADLLQLRVAQGPAVDEPRGDFLPPGGNELPVPTPIPTDFLQEPRIDLLAAAEGQVVASDAELAFAAEWSTAPPVPRATMADGDPVLPALPSGVAAVTEDTLLVNDRPAPLLVPQGKPAPQPAEMPTAVVRTASQAAPPVAVHLPAVPPATTEPPDAPRIEPSALSRAESPPRPAEPITQTAVGDGNRPNLLGDGQVVPRVFAMPDHVPPGDRPPTLPQIQPAPAAPLPTAASPSLEGARTTGAISGITADVIRTPVGEPGWGDRIGERVLMMAGSRRQQAEIRLTPAELGPVRIRIAMEDGAANVTFHAQHVATRDAIEAAMPRLREMLADNGVSLGQTSVGGDSVAEGQRERHDAPGAAGTGELPVNEGEELPSAERQISVASEGLVDTFA